MAIETIRRIIRLVLQSTTFILCCLPAKAQVAPNYWGNLKKGGYAVGFKSYCVFDTSRSYDLTFGDTTNALHDKKLGRPILINIWYPAKRGNSKKPLQIKDYFDFQGNENTYLFTSKLKDYQFKYSKLYSTDFNIKENDYSSDSLVANIREGIFNNYISSNTIAVRNLEMIKRGFPVIIYHQGLGGTIDENFLLLEYLASNGYIVVNSAFQDSDATWTLGVGDQKATYVDFNFIINHLKGNYQLKSQKVFLMGHSYGANSSIGFIGEGHQNVDGIVPLDSDLGYLLYFNYNPSAFNLFTKQKSKYYTVPIFCIARKEACFRLVDSLTLCKRHYLNIPNMKHDDFTANGAIGKYYCMTYAKGNLDQYQYAHASYLQMCPLILKFLNGCTKKSSPIDHKSMYLKDGWKFQVAEPEKKLPSNALFDMTNNPCPTISQWIDIILQKGLQEGQKTYNQCPDSSLKERKTLIDVTEALYFDANIELTIQYLEWINNITSLEKHLRDLFFIGSESFWAGREDFQKAGQFYKWMIEKYPDSEYGYMGMIVVSFHTNLESPGPYCEHLLKIDPSFENRKEKSFWEGQVVRFINAYLEHKK